MWVLFHLGPIKNEKGEVMLFLVTLKDITEFKDPIVGTGKNKTFSSPCEINRSRNRNPSAEVSISADSLSQPFLSTFIFRTAISLAKYHIPVE